MKKILLSLSILFCFVTAKAEWPNYLPRFWATYYIDPAGNNGTGTGTIGNPWATLTYACTQAVTPGDIIHVNAGTYTITATCMLAPGVSIEGDGITSVLNSTVTDGGSGNYFLPAINLIGPTVGINGNQHISNLKLTGSNLAGDMAIWVGGRSNVDIYDCTLENFFNCGIIFSGRLDGIQVPPAIYADGNSITNCIINNCARWVGFGQGCVMFGGQDNFEIGNSTITQTQRPSGQNGWPIKYMNDGYTRGGRIHHNTITKRPYQNDGWSFALEIFNFRGLEIDHNTIQGSVDFNYQGDRGTYPYVLWFHDNTVSQPTPNPFNEEGIIFEYSVDGTIIEDNVFHNLNQGIAFYPRTGTILKDMVLRRNLFSNCGTNSEGYMVGGFNGALGTWRIENFEIYNNTFNGTGTPYVALNFSGIGATDLIDGLKVKNNILQGGSLAAMLTNDRSKIINSEFTHNDFYLNGDNDNLIPTWASAGIPFPASTTVSNNLANVNPLYVGGGNFQLQGGSPLINAGTPVGLPSNGNPDIGYWESGGPDVTPPTISTVVPANTATNISVGANVVITFNEPISPASVTGASVFITGVTSTLTVDGNTVTINPDAALSISTVYTVNVTTAVEDLAGNNLVSAFTSTFTTAATTNLPPTASAGSDQTITLPVSSVNLTGSGSDVDGTVTAYAWTLVSGSGTATTPSAQNTAITGLTEGISIWRLTVTDNNSATGFDEVQITVNPAPVGGFATWDPAQKGTNLTLSNVNLTAVIANGTQAYTRATIGVTVGGGSTKNYWTITLNNSSFADASFGIVRSTVTDWNNNIDNSGDDIIIRGDGRVFYNGFTGTTLGTGFASAGKLGFAFDGVAGTLQFYYDDVALGSPITGITGTWFPYFGSYLQATNSTANFGGSAYSFVPSGFIAGLPDGSNISPVANAGANQSITLPTSSVSLTGSATDADGTVSGYLWTKVSGPTGETITAQTSASTSVNGLTEGVYIFELRATDNLGATGTDQVQITVNPAGNILPVANAGATPVSITLPINNIVLAGGGTDADGTVDAYLWTKVSGPATGTISNSNAAVAQAVNLVEGVYIFRLMVTDNDGGTAISDKQVTVNAAAPPPPTGNPQGWIIRALKRIF